jgi:Flp pilus assembly protein TadD
MKPSSLFLLVSALAVAACSPKRMSPIVSQDPAPAKYSPAPSKSVVRPTSGHRTVSRSSSTGARAHKSGVRSSSTLARSKADEAARAAEKKRRLAAARRLQARKLAVASYEAGKQFLRENQAEPALRAFRESVRLNSHSPDAWMGVAYICEMTGNTKDAIQAFREAKKLWGM